MIDPMVEAVAQRVAEKLKPMIEACQGVRPRLLTVAQAAEYFGRTVKATRHLISICSLLCVRSDNRVHLDIRDLDAWIEQNKAA